MSTPSKYVNTLSGNMVILTAFANPNKDLVALNTEENEIQKILDPLVADRAIIHITRSNIEITDLFSILKQYQNRISVLHFAGHANPEKLSLSNKNIFFEPLIEEIILRCPKSLKLVFLNGCSTYSMVQFLWERGVTAVIATRVKMGVIQNVASGCRF